MMHYRLTAAALALLSCLAQPAHAVSQGLAACPVALPDDRPLAVLSNATPCSQRYQLAWTLPLTYADIGQDWKKVLKRPEFGLVKDVIDNKSEMKIAYDPQGRPSLQLTVPRGETSQTQAALAPLGNPGLDRACMTVELYIPADFDFGTSSGKFGWGMWGGEFECSGGGCPPEQQQGWSQRNVRGSIGMKLYSYHLNRFPITGRTANTMHGEYSTRAPMLKGRWMRVEQEVAMNTPGKADGYSRLWINGRQYAEMQSLLFRCTPEWGIRGININDIWGGNPDDPDNFSPKAQTMYYSNFKLYSL